MNLNLPDQTENWVAKQAAASGMTAQQFVQKLLQEKAARELGDDSSLDHDAWMQGLREWSANHPGGTHFVDDSRESIYESRGL